MTGILTFLSILFFLGVIVGGSFLKFYTKSKLQDIDGVSGIIVYDAGTQRPPIAKL